MSDEIGTASSISTSDKVGKVLRANLGGYDVYCPGCKFTHHVNVDLPNRPRWTFDGPLEKPTFSPSVLVTWSYGKPERNFVCHSFIRDGVWEFLNDCTHKLAGQKVPMVDIDTEESDDFFHS